jgi:signal transduction histidine kinase
MLSSVATVPSTSVEGRPARDRIGDLRYWNVALAAALVLAAVYAVAPIGSSGRNVLYPFAELGAIVAIVVGVRRYRPAAPQAWLLIAGGLLAYMAGDTLWAVYELTGRDPFPSPADFLYLLGYPLIGAGLIVGIRRRSPRTDVRVILDAAIVTVSATLLGWVYVVETWGSAEGGFDAVVASAYPIADVLLCAIAIRFVLGGNWNVLALRLLVLGVALTFVGDLLFAYDTLARGVEETRVADTLLLLGVLAIGLGGLHPTMVELTEEIPFEPPELSLQRLLFLSGVALIPAVVIVVEAFRGETLYLPVAGTATLLLGALMVLRFADLTAEARRAAKREAVVGRYASELLSSNGRGTLYEHAERTASTLADGGEARVVAPGEERDDGQAFRAPIPVRGEVVAELVVDIDAAKLPRRRNLLDTVAAELSLAMEREELLEGERQVAQALAEQNEQLLELDRMKDQFVSTISHELRTPITAIIGYLELMLDGEAGDLTEQQVRFLDIVSRNSDRLFRLVNDILTVARIDAGRLTLEPAHVDLVALAAGEVESARAAADVKDVELRFVSPDDPLSLWADPMRLGQLVGNLVSNAVKFTPKGGTVTLTVDRRGDTAVVEITDTGVGIPADEVDKLFERFFRASTAATEQGTGLGLSIVKSIAEAHGGTISVRSEEGVGTTFLVELPIAREPSA